MTFLASDPDRLARFRAGDREVMAEVYRHYLSAVAQVLSRGFGLQRPEGPLHVAGLTAATDIECGCHEVFMRAFRDSARLAYDGERSYANYLFRIARNWRIDRHRSDRHLVLVADAPEPDEQAQSAEELSVASQLSALIEDFLRSRSESERRYYESRYRGGESQVGAAARQGLTRIQGRRIEARLKEALLTFLSGHGYGGEG